MSGREHLKKLSVEDRVLLLLHKFDDLRDSYTVPDNITQIGLSRDLGVRRTYITTILSSLEEKGLVEHRTKHIREGDRRKRSYFLTLEGSSTVDRMIKDLREHLVLVRDADGSLKELTLNDIRKVWSERSAMEPDLIDLVEQVHEKGEIEAPARIDGGEDARISTTGAPKIKYFVGRELELERLRTSLHDPAIKIISVVSLPGQGKTALVSQLLGEIPERSRIWIGLKEWHTANKVSSSIAKHLLDMGSREAYQRVLDPTTHDISSIAEAMAEGLHRMGLLVIIDDLHKAGMDMIEMLRSMKETSVKDDLGMKIITMGRRRMGIYSSTEVKLGDNVIEIELEGLSLEDTRKLLHYHDHRELLAEEVHLITTGIPLAIKLMMGHTSITHEEARHSMDRMIDDMLVGTLSAKDRGYLEFASVFRIPFHGEAFEELEGYEKSRFNDLKDSLMLVEYDDGRIELHDSIKDRILATMSDEVKKVQMRRAMNHYLKRSGDEDIMELLHLSYELGEGEIFLQNFIENGEYLALTGNMELSRYLTELQQMELSKLHLVRLHMIRSCMEQTSRNLKGSKDELRKARSILLSSRKEEIPIVEKTSLMAMLSLRKAELDREKGMHQQAVEEYRESLKIVERTGDSEGSAKIHNNMGVSFLEMGQLDEASDHLSKALESLEGNGNERIKAMVSTNMGELLLRLDDTEGALEQFRSAVKISTGAGPIPGIYRAYVKVFELEKVSQGRDDGPTFLRKGLIMACREGDIEYAVSTLENNFKRIDETISRRDMLEILRSCSGEAPIQYSRWRTASPPDAETEGLLSYIRAMRSLMEREWKEAMENIRKHLFWASGKMRWRDFIDRTVGLVWIVEKLAPSDMPHHVLSYALKYSKRMKDRRAYPTLLIIIAGRAKKEELSYRKFLQDAARISKSIGFSEGERKARQMM